MHGEPRNIRLCIRANRGSNGLFICSGAIIVRNFHDLGGNRIVPVGAGYRYCGMFNTPDGIAGTIVQPDGKYLILT